jgi:hypothetical protein
MMLLKMETVILETRLHIEYQGTGTSRYNLYL